MSAEATSKVVNAILTIYSHRQATNRFHPTQTGAKARDWSASPTGLGARVCLTLIICVELLLQLLHLFVVSQQSLVSFQRACGLLLLLLSNVPHQRVLVIVGDAYGTNRLLHLPSVSLCSSRTH